MLPILHIINEIFIFFLPIIIPVFLGAIALIFHKFKFIDIFIAEYADKRKALGNFTYQMVFGLFSFDLWAIISFAENSPVGYFSKNNAFEEKYGIVLFTLLLHLFTYIYCYTRENMDEFKDASEKSLEGVKCGRWLRRDMRYWFLLFFSFAPCVLIRF